ncbi:DsbA family protein [Pedobacter sp.]|uniref:DsbA family protein n=1 Tax=Pedobacter sp. TaxID=1411316 RepID=UPI003C3F4677
MSTNLTPDINDHDNIQGSPEAIITLVEYGDYLCPHCGHAYPIVKQLQQEFGDQLKVIFRNFPLRKIHPLASPAAVAAEAAAQQGKFWEMHDLIFENQANLQKSSFAILAEQIGLNMTQFNRDIEDPQMTQKVDLDFESGIMSGVNGTPTFFVNGTRYNGSWEAEELAIFFNTLINNKS